MMFGLLAIPFAGGGFVLFGIPGALVGGVIALALSRLPQDEKQTAGPEGPAASLTDRVLATQVVPTGVTASGTQRFRIESRAEQIRLAFLCVRMTVWVVVLVGGLLFHDSILAWLGSQMGRNAAPLAGGFLSGMFGR